MENPFEILQAAQVATVRVTAQVREVLRADYEARPLRWKLAASHEALLCSVSPIALNCHRTSGRLFRERLL